MKKIIPVIIVLIPLGFAQAQISKGRSIAGVGINYSQSSQKSQQPSNSGLNEYIYSNTNVSARYGYFVSDHIALGVSGSISFSARKERQEYTTYKTNVKEKGTGFNGGVFGRYYQMIGESKFAFFGQLSAAYGSGNGKRETTDNFNVTQKSDTQFSSFGFGVSPGLTFFINERFGLEAQFGGISYFSVRQEETSNGVVALRTTNNNVSANFLQNIFLGVSFYFGKSKTTT